MQERVTREDLRVEPLREEPQVQQEPVHERYAEGEPPDTAPAKASHDRTASQLAYEDDGNVRELKAKVSKLVASKFGGDYKLAFSHYAGNAGVVGKGPLKDLLADAGVGNGLTRGAWVNGIIAKLDQNGDGAISWEEFQHVTSAVA